MSPDIAALDAWIADLAAARHPGVFNPWGEVCEMDLDPRAAVARCERLRRHLQAPEPRWIMLGEAAGWQGARYTGCAFTSERLLLEGVIPRMPATGGRRLSRRERPFSEPSATNVWKALYRNGIAEQTLLWNAFAFHPQGPRPLSNRAPTRNEQRAGLDHLLGFLEMFPAVPVIAVGRVAESCLRSLGRSDVVYLRHPSYGGVPAFNQGIAMLVRQTS